MQVIKLGGSVITDKSRYKTVRKLVLRRLAREIAAAKTPTVVVHGAGSFGHVLAKKHELGGGYKSIDQLKGFAEVHRDVRELNMFVVNELIDSGINAVTLPPASIVKAENGQISDINTHRFSEFLALGLCPVTFGDVVLDSKIGFCVCSGDAMVYRIAAALSARRAVFVTDVDGIYWNRGGHRRIITHLTHIKQVGKFTVNHKNGSAKGRKKGKEPDDVTGGIRGKASVMLSLGQSGIDCILINGNAKGRLLSALRGEPVIGTFVKSTPRTGETETMQYHYY